MFAPRRLCISPGGSELWLLPFSGTEEGRKECEHIQKDLLKNDVSVFLKKHLAVAQAGLELESLLT